MVVEWTKLNWEGFLFEALFDDSWHDSRQETHEWTKSH